MTDFVFAHVRRPVRCNHEVVTFGAGHSYGEQLSIQVVAMTTSLIFGFLWRGEIKAL